MSRHFPWPPTGETALYISLIVSVNNTLLQILILWSMLGYFVYSSELVRIHWWLLAFNGKMSLSLCFWWRQSLYQGIWLTLNSKNLPVLLQRLMWLVWLLCTRVKEGLLSLPQTWASEGSRCPHMSILLLRIMRVKLSDSLTSA